MTDLDIRLPLRGVRVLDCSRVLAGPLATMHLADLGADVIKLESPQGDETRTWGPPFWGEEGEGRSAYFAAINRNKRSLVVDLKTDDGVALLDRLAATSDLLVHNFRPATASRLHLSSDRLRRTHPHLIVAAIGGFPGDGHARPAYDLLAQAVSGLMSVTGDPSGGPTKVGVALLDVIAGLELAVGALAALAGRHDRGSTVDVSLVEVGTSSLTNVLGNFLASGEEPGRHGNAHPNIAPYQTFQVADGHVVIAVGNDAQFARLLTALRLEDADGRFATNPQRLARRDELTGWLAEVMLRRRRDELVEALLAADVPAGPVLSVGEAVHAMESSNDSAWLEEVDGMRLAPNPVVLDGKRVRVQRPPPRLGEHTDEILAELGLTSPEIEALRRAGCVH